MAGVEQLSREQLLVVVAEQAWAVEDLTAKIGALTERVAELTRRLGQSSGNFSLPAVDGPVRRTEARSPPALGA